ncbi:MAG TPA: lysylphosphatidylglycerol synthase transmembrane domain-containing protein [Candidatus Acidoferrales bacterium]|nr:lysylphosphatidylglycerol synthase transmembrane domain-containing protein [Candidatus Acidoferrales bacterium]
MKIIGAKEDEEYGSQAKSNPGIEDGLHRPGPPLSFSARRTAGIVLKVLAASIIVFILWRQFVNVKVDSVLALLDRVGFAVMLVLIPPLLELLAESLGLALCIPGTGPFRRLFKVLPVRIGCDTLINSLPAGVVPAETLRPIWLRRACNVPIEESFAACLMGKINMAAAQGLFLTVIMALIIFAGPAHGSAAALSGRTMMPAVALLALVFAAVIYIYSGARLTQLASLLKRITWNRWRRFLSRIESSVNRIDATILHFSRQNRRALFGSLASFVVGWTLLGCESYVILRILGQSITVGQGFLMEGTACLLRIAFFFIPSAFGATEAAYVSLIASFGVADAPSVALAFITIKRSREVIWIVLGYLAIMIYGRSKAGDAGSLHRVSKRK